MQITLIGAGNLAWHLAPQLEQAGHSVERVYSRHLENARHLSQKLKAAQPVDELNFSQAQSEGFVLAVSDDALPALATQLQLPPAGWVVHTSGSQPLAVLVPLQTNERAIGVFYPVQTFSKSKAVDFEEIPICVEASDMSTAEHLAVLARQMSREVVYLNSSQRKMLHLAAIFASNFTNRLYRIAETILEREGIFGKLLHPLIAETTDKALRQGPWAAQTGPARRGDQNTLEAHLQYLEEVGWESERQLYQLISHHILQDYAAKNQEK